MLIAARWPPGWRCPPTAAGLYNGSMLRLILLVIGAIILVSVIMAVIGTIVGLLIKLLLIAAVIVAGGMVLSMARRSRSRSARRGR